MSLATQRSSFFIADFEVQFAWYVEKAGPEVAWRFQTALDMSLSTRPDLGTIRHFRNAKLRDLRSYRVEPPFKKLLIFYRVGADCLQVVRLMHGTRDLPSRLAEPPENELSDSASIQ